jgi:hypothetical protein
VQALEVTQLTLVSTAPATSALDCSAQLVPFHNSDALPFHRSATVLRLIRRGMQDGEQFAHHP